MTLNVKKILDELYAIDPSLRAQESNLEKVILELLKTKPETRFDEHFAKQLKQRLTELPHIEQIKTSKFNSIFSINMNRTLVALGGTAFALLLVLTALASFGNKLPTLNNQSNLSFGEQKISRMAKGAFGKLAFNQAGAQATGAADASSRSAAPMAFGMGGGGGVGVAENASPKMAGDMGIGIMPPLRIYKYVYKGEPLEIKETSLDVYRRTPPSFSTQDLVQSLGRVTFGGVDLSTFNNASLTNFELVQKTDDGYIVNLNLNDGYININQNYSSWYKEQCQNGVCNSPAPLTMSDVPADEIVIALADQFLKDHKIDMTNYDRPEVDNQWKTYYLNAGRVEGTIYVPDSVTVIYPLKVNGKVVYEIGGEKRGIRVSVDIRKNKVSGAWNITSQNYESSSYDVETDATKIIKIAENGGIYGGPVYYSKEVKTEEVELQLGTPEQILTIVWNPQDQKEVTVPALKFPITNLPTDQMFWQKNIVVPIVKDVLETVMPQTRIDSVPSVTEPARPLILQDAPVAKPEAEVKR